jgi:hypothetical protein
VLTTAKKYLEANLGKLTISHLLKNNSFFNLAAVCRITSVIGHVAVSPQLRELPFALITSLKRECENDTYPALKRDGP